jgi:GTP-binding protein
MPHLLELEKPVKPNQDLSFIFRTTMKISSVEFIGAAAQPGTYPKLSSPEIAFAGRSNVGKSSLINRLLNRKIARTSATPGRTQQLNFFSVNQQITFVDLPGYGYARVAKQERQQWQRLIEDYLITARNLRGVVMIVDIRRGPEAEEAALCDFLTHHDRPFVLVATKCDKLKRGQIEQQRKAIATRLGSIPPVLFSAESGMGREELWQELWQLAFPEIPTISPELSDA